MKYNVGDIVVPHEFANGEEGLYFVESMMSQFIGHPCLIDDVPYTDKNIYRIKRWMWPESALTPYQQNMKQIERPPQSYDLKEFVLAALTGLCANSGGIMTRDSRRSFHPDDISELAIVIGKSTMEAFQKQQAKSQL